MQSKRKAVMKAGRASNQRNTTVAPPTQSHDASTVNSFVDVYGERVYGADMRRFSRRIGVAGSILKESGYDR